MALFDFGRGKRKAPRSAADRLASGSWTCSSCDATHGWPFDLAAAAPDCWPHDRVHAPNSMIRFDGDFLSEDFCVMDGEYFMVRCVLSFPVIGVPGEFGWGCWSTLSRENFETYVMGFDEGVYENDGPWTGWLMNGLADMTDGKEPLELWVEPQPGRQRSRLWAAREGHPLKRAQQDGITAERMLEIFAYYGHAPA